MKRLQQHGHDHTIQQQKNTTLESELQLRLFYYGFWLIGPHLSHLSQSVRRSLQIKVVVQAAVKKAAK